MLRLDGAFMPDNLSKRTREKLSWQMENDTALSSEQKKLRHRGEKGRWLIDCLAFYPEFVPHPNLPGP